MTGEDQEEGVDDLRMSGKSIDDVFPCSVTVHKCHLIGGELMDMCDFDLREGRKSGPSEFNHEEGGKTIYSIMMSTIR
jgi:hypothetical protein